MPMLDLAGAAIQYSVQGAGPAVLIPCCNFGWSPSIVARLAQEHTVIVASPRGFQGSDRGLDPYSATTIRTDLEGVVSHLGIDQYATFGYSMTGSIAPWLAHDNSRVTAVISGGFPIAGPYQAFVPYIERTLRSATTEPISKEAVLEQFDPAALLAWYRHLDTMPSGALVDRVQCPLYSFWGGADELLDMLAGLDNMKTAAESRQLSARIFPNYDHEQLLEDLEVVVLPAAIAWLDATILS